MAVVLPQIFQVALEFRRRSRNHFFWVAPRIVWALVFAVVRDLDAAESNRRRRFPSVIGPSGVENLQGLLGNELQEIAVGQRVGFGMVGRVFGAVAALIGDDQLDILPPAQSAIAGQAADGGEIVGFLPEAVIVKLSDGRVCDMRRVEAVE